MVLACGGSSPSTPAKLEKNSDRSPARAAFGLAARSADQAVSGGDLILPSLKATTFLSFNNRFDPNMSSNSTFCASKSRFSTILQIKPTVKTQRRMGSTHAVPPRSKRANCSSKVTYWLINSAFFSVNVCRSITWSRQLSRSNFCLAVKSATCRRKSSPPDRLWLLSVRSSAPFHDALAFVAQRF